MEEAIELASYLPLSFKTPKEQEYIEFIWDVFETNYTHGKYQFAFLAYHMLTMSFVYFNIWQIKQTRPEDLAKAMIGCDNGKIGSYTALVKERNDNAHTNGNIFFSTQAALDAKIAEVLRVVGEIQEHSKDTIQNCYRDFLPQNHDPDEREYTDAADQIREVLIHGNYMSQKDIEICLGFDVAALAAEPRYHSMCELHDVLKENYGPEEVTR